MQKEKSYFKLKKNKKEKTFSKSNIKIKNCNNRRLRKWNQKDDEKFMKNDYKIETLLSYIAKKW